MIDEAIYKSSLMTPHVSLTAEDDKTSTLILPSLAPIVPGIPCILQIWILFAFNVLIWIWLISQNLNATTQNISILATPGEAASQILKDLQQQLQHQHNVNIRSRQQSQESQATPRAYIRNQNMVILYQPLFPVYYLLHYAIPDIQSKYIWFGFYKTRVLLFKTLRRFKHKSLQYTINI